jgi:signal transduction histidine kinase
MRDELPDAAALRRSLQTIERQSRRLARLVTQLLETVRLQEGQLRLDRTETDLSDLVRHVAEQIQEQTSQHELIVHATEPTMAWVDELRIEQVITNLLDNAVKFSPEGGRIEVELSRQGAETVRLTVRDFGLGVAAEHRPHLFGRFYQAHVDHQSGMGLGLFVGQAIVREHGGELSAEFPPDGGSRFVMDLPLGPEAISEESR